MLKGLLSIVLIALLLLNGMVYSVIQGSYELNKADIIENFCVNKSKPMLNCDGKCYLAQQLQAEKERRDQQAGHSFSFDFGQYIASSPLLLAGVLPEDVVSVYGSELPAKIQPSFFGNIEIPPRI
jgi:hypothetical protein